jgi:hypothetical protein
VRTQIGRFTVIGFDSGQVTRKEAKHFFDKKKQKTFALALFPPSASHVSLRGKKQTKVFWFFFQKRTFSYSGASAN